MRDFFGKTSQYYFSWAIKNAGILIIGFFLVLHLALINDYGLTWDFHFHFFGGAKLLRLDWQQIEPRDLRYIEPDPRQAWSLPYGPIMSIVPVASFLLLYKTLGILPYDSAYNLPIIFWGVLGLLVLYFFMRQAFNAKIALLSSLFLALTPRYFGDTHNNMKDIPMAAIFALNMWLLWRLLMFKRMRDLLAASLGFALAFNTKVNAVFIPVIFIVWVLIYAITKLRNNRETYGIFRLAFPYFIFSFLFAFLLWWFFWDDPVGQLHHMVKTFGIGTNNIEVLLNGKWYCSGGNVPWYYPYLYLAITTPIPILIFFIFGIISSLLALSKKNLKSGKNSLLLLLLWFFLPLTRYLIPKIGVIDGIRHFEEVLYPLSALAAVGFLALLQNIKNSLVKISLIIATVIFLSFQVILYHPYQITYFNELVGGVKGAFGRYDLDYWGTSQKQAVLWLNKNAKPDSHVHIVMTANVSAIYLRPDLLKNLNTAQYDNADYVVVLNRQSFFYRYYWLFEYLLWHKPVYSISVRDAPLVWIFKTDKAKLASPIQPWWTGEDPCIRKYW